MYSFKLLSSKIKRIHKKIKKLLRIKKKMEIPSNPKEKKRLKKLKLKLYVVIN